MAVCYFTDFSANLLIHAFLKLYLAKHNYTQCKSYVWETV